MLWETPLSAKESRLEQLFPGGIFSHSPAAQPSSEQAGPASRDADPTNRHDCQIVSNSPEARRKKRLGEGSSIADEHPCVIIHTARKLLTGQRGEEGHLTMPVRKLVHSKQDNWNPHKRPEKHLKKVSKLLNIREKRRERDSIISYLAKAPSMLSSRRLLTLVGTICRDHSDAHDG